MHKGGQDTSPAADDDCLGCVQHWSSALLVCSLSRADIANKHLVRPLLLLLAYSAISCRITGSATLLGVSAYFFYEVWLCWLRACAAVSTSDLLCVRCGSATRWRAAKWASVAGCSRAPAHSPPRGSGERPPGSSTLHRHRHQRNLSKNDSCIRKKQCNE